MDQLTLVMIILVALVLLARRPDRAEIIGLGIILSLVFTGLLDAAEAVSGFASVATLTVAALFVISAGLTRTGAPQYLVERLAGWSRGRPIRLLILLTLTIPLASAFMNNTAVVVLFIPVILTLSRRFRLSPSRFLMPISFLSILGGTCTLIGSSTNLLVHEVFVQWGGPGFGLFEFTAAGSVYLAVGAVYILLLTRKVLPEHPVVSAVLDPDQRREYVTEVVVGSQSELVGRPMPDVVARYKDMKILELVRGEMLYWPPFAGLQLEAGDLLVVRTPPQTVLEAVGRKRFDFAPEIGADEIRSVDSRIAEVLILPGSRFLNQRLADVEFHRRWGVKVLGIQRHGHHLRSQIGRQVLRVGDMLLVQAEPAGLRRLADRPDDFVVLDQLWHQLVDTRRIPLSVGILVAVVALVSFGVAAHVAALTGAALMILTGCVRTEGAIRSLDFSVLMLLAGTIPLGLAMERTGLAADLAAWVVGQTGDWGPRAQVVVFFALTSVLSSVLSNNATAVVMAPIALSTAQSLGLDPKPLLMAVVFGASACFATPIGYQTNLLVLAPGGYRFGDYLRFGVPLTLLLLAASVVIIPWFWPFVP